MGILNVSPDSFYDGGKYLQSEAMIGRVSEMLAQGADIIDVGACSSRPGATEVSVEEEMERLRTAFQVIRPAFPNAIFSVDTYRSIIAAMVVVEFGVSMINDISSGTGDKDMFSAVAKYKVPYLMMHMQGTPQTMQRHPVYNDVTQEIISFFVKQLEIAKAHNIQDILLDPGFGFGKTIPQNYTLLRELESFLMLGCPLVVGLSRKSMIYKSLQISPQDALNGTTALHVLALINGASLLRVHDVKEAVETIRLLSLFQGIDMNANKI
jgi:dihydropteroate synthase